MTNRKSKRGLVRNISVVCLVFVLISMIFAIIILNMNIKSEQTYQSHRSEDLSGLRSMLYSLAGYIDNKDEKGIEDSSRYIRESGALSALSQSNRRPLYAFLRSIDSHELTEYLEYGAYVRKCIACTEAELSMDNYTLEPFGAETEDINSVDGKNAIKTAKLHSFLDMYPSMYSDGNHVVTYGSNYYKKINWDLVYEYLYLSNTFDHEMDSCDIGYLGEKLRSHIGDGDLLSDISFLFCEMGVAFFTFSTDAHSFIAGVSADGEHLYMLSSVG